VTGHDAPPSTYAVADCGGTHTRLEIWRGQDQVAVDKLASANTASTSPDEAKAVYGDVVARVAAHGVAETYVATAAFDDSNAAELEAVFGELVREHGYPGRIHLFNDVAPLLFTGERGTETVASIIGTGSAFWARDHEDRLARIGGVEWLGSDEGAAADLGKRALVAMVRAADGRAGATTITARAGYDDAGALTLARELGETAHPKRGLATLAKAVTAAWVEDGDETAAAIVTAAVADVEAALTTAARHLATPAAATWVFCGGLISGSLDYQRLILGAVARASGGASDVRVVENALESLRSFAAHGWADRLTERYRRTVSA
jgi:N-acetylglucosamine kinase-like BadF-type ATPase